MTFWSTETSEVTSFDPIGFQVSLQPCHSGKPFNISPHRYNSHSYSIPLKLYFYKIISFAAMGIVRRNGSTASARFPFEKQEGGERHRKANLVSSQHSAQMTVY